MKRNYLKKVLSLVMATAFVVTSVPGTALKVNAAVTKTELPTPVYQFEFNGNLNEKNGKATAVTKIDNLGNNGPGEANYVDGRTAGEKAVRFNNDYGLDLNLPIDSRPKGSYTVSMWAKMESGQKGFSSLVLGTNNPENWVSVCTDGIWTRAEQVLTGTSNVSNDWVQYVLSVDENLGVASLYRNGKYVAERKAAVGTLSGSGTLLALGANYWDGYIVGSIDDVEIYDSALNAAQVDALYEGAGVSLSAEDIRVRVGGTMEVDASLANVQEGDSLVWTSTNTAVATVDENGIVKGLAEGDTIINASLMRGNAKIAEADFSVRIVEKGNLIADFTFDNDETGFRGAGAVANKANNANNLTVENIEGRGGVLVLQGQYGNPDLNYLDVKKEDGFSLLGTTEEFTVSYDAISEGAFQNCWLFSVDDNGEWNHMSIADYPNDVQAYTMQSGTADGAHDTYAEGAWKHVDVVFGVNDSRVYIDGELKGQVTRTATVQEIIGNNSFMYIGKSTNWANEYWSGKLDNFKIYDYALTAEEIREKPVTTIQIDGAPENAMKIGEEVTLKAVVNDDATNKKVTWSSSDDAVASVDENGKVIAKAAGDVTITATAKDGSNIQQSVTIKVAPNEYVITIISADAEMGTVSGVGTYAEGTKVTLQATTNKGYHFVGWYEGETLISENSEYEIAVDGDHSYTAKFEKNALIKHDKVEPTCTDTGMKEYWEDEATGKLYADAEGTQEVAEADLVIPVAHDYEFDNWSWIETAEGYDASVTVVCQKCNDTKTVSAEVTSEKTDGKIKYTASVEIDGKPYVATKEVIQGYKVTVVNGTIKDGKTDYMYQEQATVTASLTTDEGKFAGWKDESGNYVCYALTYSFPVIRDIILTADYSKEEVEKAVVINCSAGYNASTGKIFFTASRAVPVAACAEKKVVEHGVIVIKGGTKPTEDEFVIGKANVLKSAATTTFGLVGTYNVNVKCDSGTTCYARGYVKYKDAKTNEIKTVYSTITEYTKP